MINKKLTKPNFNHFVTRMNHWNPWTKLTKPIINDQKFNIIGNYDNILSSSKSLRIFGWEYVEIQ